MHRSHFLGSLASSLLAMAATAQAGSMKLMAPVVLGLQASMVIEHSPALAGNLFAMGMCSPSYPGTMTVSVPGVRQGIVRLDPLAYSVLGSGVLDASGKSAALTFLVPDDPMLLGASFDVQGATIDANGLITFTSNELEIVVAAPPPAALNMVRIAPGTFLMGSAAIPPPSFDLPIHPVTITRPFWIGKYEVTQAEYSAVTGTNPSYFYQAGPTHPVDQVGYNSAVAYCAALSALEAAAGRLPSGYVYRLPTEAEWEYCCRAGTTSEWSVGNSLSCPQANFYNVNNPCVPGPLGWGIHTPVGSYPPNAWGLHDMHGNVFEWCLDRWNTLANYPAGAVSDPYVTVGLNRICRGGSWNHSADVSRSGRRSGGAPGAANSSFGLRVVCAPILP